MAFNRIIQRSGYRNYFAVLIIQGAIDHSCLENCSGAKYKIFTSYRCNVFNFQHNNIPLRWLSTASSGSYFDYPYACIHWLIIEDFVIVEIQHCRHFFLNVFYDTVVIHVLPGNLKTLKNMAFPPLKDIVHTVWRCCVVESGTKDLAFRQGKKKGVLNKNWVMLFFLLYGHIILWCLKEKIVQPCQTHTNWSRI